MIVTLSALWIDIYFSSLKRNTLSPSASLLVVIRKGSGRGRRREPVLFYTNQVCRREREQSREPMNARCCLSSFLHFLLSSLSALLPMVAPLKLPGQVWGGGERRGREHKGAER